MESFPDFTAIGLLGVLVLLLVRDVIVPLIAKLKGGDQSSNGSTGYRQLYNMILVMQNQMTRVEAELAEQHQWRGSDQVGARRAEGQVGDMHGWQSPDSQGRQDWRGSRMLDMLERQHQILNEIVEMLKKK